MARNEEKNGIVYCKAPWGMWWQTMDDVTIEINVEVGTTSKEIQCNICNKSISVSVKGEKIIEGKFPKTVHAEDSFWTLEDRKLLRILLSKTDKRAANCWKALLQEQYKVDPLTFDDMERKITLEHFEREHPTFDFSDSTVSGDYHGGGPEIPS